MKCHAQADPLNILGTVIEQKKLIKSEIIVNFFFSFPNRNILLCFIPVSFYEKKLFPLLRIKLGVAIEHLLSTALKRRKKKKSLGMALLKNTDKVVKVIKQWHNIHFANA